MKKFGLSFALLLIAGSAQAYPSVVATSSTSYSGNLQKDNTVVAVDSEAYSNFTMHHVYSTDTNVTYKGSLVILPSLLGNFKEYEITDSGNYSDTLAGYFASRGYDVYGYSPPTTNVAPGACQPDGSLDCSFMNGWSLARYVSDINYIRDAIDNDHCTVSSCPNPAIGGLSLGTMMAIAAVNSRPGDYAGLMMWEGSLLWTDTTRAATMATFCAQDEAALLSGGYSNNVLYNGLTTAYNGGHLAWVTFLNTPNPRLGGIPTLKTCDGDVLTNTFTYADDNRLYHLLWDGNGYESNRIFRDVDCSLAGSETSFVSNLSSYTNPILMIEAGQGMREYPEEMLSLYGTSSSDVTIEFHSGRGHADTYMGTDHVTVSESRILNWLDNVVF